MIGTLPKLAMSLPMSKPNYKDSILTVVMCRVSICGRKSVASAQGSEVL